MALLPIPRGRNNLIESRVLRRPAQLAANFLAARDEHGGVSGAAREEHVRNLAAGDAAGSFDDFENRVAAAVADVEGIAGKAVDLLESKHMGIGDVEDVDVVADAGAVGRGIVGAKDLDVRLAAEGHVEDAGNEVGLHAMGFAAVMGGASGCGGTAARWPSPRWSSATTEWPRASRTSEQMLPM